MGEQETKMKEKLNKKRKKGSCTAQVRSGKVLKTNIIFHIKLFYEVGAKMGGN